MNKTLVTLVKAATAALAIGVLATGSAQTSGGVLTGGFDVGPGGLPGVFNPLVLTAGLTWIEKYFSPLVQYDVNFQKIGGELAKSWIVTRDGKTYNFVLRDNVKWHDGQPFTAQDVKFTLDLYRNPDSGSIFTPRLENVASVKTSGAHGVIITLSKPTAPFLDNLSFIMMLPEHALKNIPVKDLAKSSWWSTAPIGTGPFKFNKLVPDQYVELTAFNDYWRGKPKLDKLINRYFKEAGSAVLALRSGEIQFTYVSGDEAAGLKGDPNITVLPGPSHVANYIGFNFKDPRFKDLRVRQAILSAIDRKSIIAQLYNGAGSLASCAYTDAQFVPKKGLSANAYDPERAKQLLKDANWSAVKDNGPALELLTYYGDKLSSDVMVTIQQMLSQVGVNVKVRTVDVATYNQTTTAGNFTLTFAGQGNGPDPETANVLFESTAARASGANRFSIAMPQLDQLIAQSRVEINPRKRAAVFQNLCAYQNAQLPVADLWEAQRFGAVSKKVQTFVWTPAPGGGRYNDFAETWRLK